MIFRPFGAVYKAVNRDLSIQLAVKIIEATKTSDLQAEIFILKVLILK